MDSVPLARPPALVGASSPGRMSRWSQAPPAASRTVRSLEQRSNMLGHWLAAGELGKGARGAGGDAADQVQVDVVELGCVIL